MKNLTARFTSPTDATLAVIARKGAKDIRVFVQMRTPGAKVVTGLRNVFTLDHEADATAKFEALKTDAAKQGWTQKVITTGSAFTAMPAAPKAATAKK
jgi:hypothetical protein